MKLCTLFFLLYLLCPAIPGRAQGIVFEDLGWEEALAKAGKENKLVFLEAYTSWCAPCKRMAENTFPDPAAGRFYNTRFVNLRMDMEHREGPALAARFGVDVYPTLLFFDPDGAVAHRAAGFHDAAGFLALGEKAADRLQNLAALEKRYRSGDRSASLLLRLLETRAAAQDPRTGELAVQYLRSAGDPGSEQSMDVTMKYLDDPYSEGFKFLLQNRAAFERRYLPKTVQEKIEAVFENYLLKHPQLQLGEIQRLYAALYPEQSERLASAYRMTYYRQKEQPGQFAESAIDHYRRFPMDDPEELNEMAAIFCDFVADKEHLQQALEWSKQSVNIQEMWHNRLTLARLYAKTGKKKAARQSAMRAQALARAAGEDIAGIQQFLKEIDGENRGN
jgi:thiol-disulfide isomerase/thioredoxin